MPQQSIVVHKGARDDDVQTRRFWPLTLGAIGVVYGDIGTSPIYAFREAVSPQPAKPRSRRIPCWVSSR